MAAVYIWVRTLGRFTTFDGLSEALIFHMSRNTEVLPITVYAGPHPTNLSVISGRSNSVDLPRGNMSCTYIHTETETLYICM